MVKFAHIADVHLGGWKQQQMQDLNFESFKRAVDICINSKLDFILFAGDLFDSAYPPIEVLKDTFAQFKRIKDVNIPCFIIAGSHDYSVSGKTFLDVLEKAGFCKNVYNAEERDNLLILNPVVYGNVAYNRAISAGYCGDFEVGSEARNGCSSVRTINYNPEDLSKYCSIVESIE